MRSPYGVNISVFQPAVQQGYNLFTRMRMTFTGTRPFGPSKQTQVYKLRRQAKTFYWG